MDKLHQEITEKLYLISNGLVEDYYGVSSRDNLQGIHSLILDKGRWTSKGWNIPRDVNLRNFNLTRLPKFHDVGMHFNCSENELVSLEGCPSEVYGNFACSDNKLATLQGGPKKSSAYVCSNNQLVSLKGAPKLVYNVFDCSHNQLRNLKHGPENVFNFGGMRGDFICSHNQLHTLKGSPKIVEGIFDCSNNQLTSLLLGPDKVLGDYFCDYNPLESRRTNTKIYGRLYGYPEEYDE